MYVAGIDTHATYSVTCVVEQARTTRSGPHQASLLPHFSLDVTQQVRLRFNRFRHRSWYDHTACAAGGMGRL